MLLAGRTCVVTGGASGIGAATARVLVREGARVAVLDRRADDARAVVEALAPADGGPHLALEADVADPAAVRRAFTAVLEAFGRLDGLVSCAGIRITGDPLEVTPEDWHHVMDVNLSGAFYCAQHAGRAMVAQGSGSIVNISSAAGLVAVDRRVAYNASKAGLLGLTRGLARDLGGRGVRVNAVCPGLIRTPLTEPYFEDEAWVAALSDVIPSGSAGEPEHIGDACAFLLSDLAAYITGIALPVDGGFTAYGSFGSPSAFTADRRAR
ncbi:SDR family NAD(P)-dependent oxidoreductase [Baekduia soli]|nr:SDR family NAD(P)-dependent oxidoreductase [Baekduia soli]